MTERFIGVDIGGELAVPPHHVYCVATRYSRKGQKKWVVCLTRNRIGQLSHIPEWREKLSAILIYKSINGVLQENYAIHIDKDFHGTTQKKVSGYLKRLFGVLHFNEEYLANPPFEFLPKEYSNVIDDADKKATLARRRALHPDETDPPIDNFLNILEKARRKGAV